MSYMNVGYVVLHLYFVPDVIHISLFIVFDVSNDGVSIFQNNQHKQQQFHTESQAVFPTTKVQRMLAMVHASFVLFSCALRHSVSMRVCLWSLITVKTQHNKACAHLENTTSCNISSQHNCTTCTGIDVLI